MGSQLRYLLLAGWEVVGAIGFGPPSFYLSCRDCWMGWEAQGMEQNRPRVVCLSRFLMRPKLHGANLASRAYRLVWQRVRADWLDRYGVAPVLVETHPHLPASVLYSPAELGVSCCALGVEYGGRGGMLRHLLLNRHL